MRAALPAGPEVRRQRGGVRGGEPRAGAVPEGVPLPRHGVALRHLGREGLVHQTRRTGNNGQMSGI